MTVRDLPRIQRATSRRLGFEKFGFESGCTSDDVDCSIGVVVSAVL
jgi:hypothetical protein